MRFERLVITTLVLCALPVLAAASIPPEKQRAEPTVAKECRHLRQAALEKMKEPPILERGTPKGERWEALLGRAVSTCEAAAESARDPEIAAELKAEEYLARMKLAPRTPDPGERSQGEILLEGIEAIRGLSNDRSPASIELLRLAGYRFYDEDPDYGHELIELAVDIAREAYGDEDPRYAEELRHLAALHAPNPLHARTGTELARPDPKKAERLLREALGVYLLDDSLVGGNGYRQTVLVLKGLYAATGREKEAEEMRAVLDEIHDEQRREREAKALEQEAERLAEDEEGESAPTSAEQ